MIIPYTYCFRGGRFIPCIHVILQIKSITIPFYILFERDWQIYTVLFFLPSIEDDERDVRIVVQVIDYVMLGER